MEKEEDENHFVLKFHSYAHIRSQFQNICNSTNLPNLLTQQNYGYFGEFLSNLFDHIIKMIKKTN
jgi:hypothetical protein